MAKDEVPHGQRNREPAIPNPLSVAQPPTRSPAYWLTVLPAHPLTRSLAHSLTINH